MAGPGLRQPRLHGRAGPGLRPAVVSCALFMRTFGRPVCTAAVAAWLIASSISFAATDPFLAGRFVGVGVTVPLGH